MMSKAQRQRFSSRILPPYMRRSPKVTEVLPILYLRALDRRFPAGAARLAGRGRGRSVADP